MKESVKEMLRSEAGVVGHRWANSSMGPVIQLQYDDKEQIRIKSRCHDYDRNSVLVAVILF